MILLWNELKHSNELSESIPSLKNLQNEKRTLAAFGMIKKSYQPARLRSLIKSFPFSMWIEKRICRVAREIF